MRGGVRSSRPAAPTCGGPESEVTVMVPVTITATVLATFCHRWPGRVEHHRRARDPRSSRRPAPPRRAAPPAPERGQSRWPRRPRDGRIGRVARDDEPLCHLLSRQLLRRSAALATRSPAVRREQASASDRDPWWRGRSATTAPKAIKPDGHRHTDPGPRETTQRGAGSWPAPHGLVGVAHGDVAWREDRLDDRPVLPDPPQRPAPGELGHEEGF